MCGWGELANHVKRDRVVGVLSTYVVSEVCWGRMYEDGCLMVNWRVVGIGGSEFMEVRGGKKG